MKKRITNILNFLNKKKTFSASVEKGFYNILIATISLWMLYNFTFLC